MADFRSYRAADRVPAKPMEPVSDPAGWSPETLGPIEGFSYRLSARDADELVAATALFRALGAPVEEVRRDNFPLDQLAVLLAQVKRELAEGRGIVMLRGFPLERLDREGRAIAYLGLGSYLGAPMSQNKDGHILGHVKDLGGDYSDPDTRGYLTRAEMRFHSDACDYVGLLCLQPARAGGASRVASSVTVYNRMLANRPELAQALCEDWYRSRSGEMNSGEEPWIRCPIFCFHQGCFSALGLGAAVDKAYALPGVPPMTALQKEAIELYRATVEDCAADMEFRPGDIQLLNNFVTLHTRRAYEDWPQPERKRHLLRLWLRDPASRPLPKEIREGRTGRGVHLAGVKLSAPLDVVE
ncbi:MAG: TauD/TfdA family dioxygenase [Alphaproteobacteria bacterium]|nr:TauD/TfdA family dioxygenase [Alphaproteobacteria bacterium]